MVILCVTGTPEVESVVHGRDGLLDRMQHHDAYMNPATHQMQQTIHLATANQGTQDPDDMFTVLSRSGPEEIRDTGADAACNMESLDDTPTYEM